MAVSHTASSRATERRQRLTTAGRTASSSSRAGTVVHLNREVSTTDRVSHNTDKINTTKDISSKAIHSNRSTVKISNTVSNRNMAKVSSCKVRTSAKGDRGAQVRFKALELCHML